MRLRPYEEINTKWFSLLGSSIHRFRYAVRPSSEDRGQSSAKYYFKLYIALFIEFKIRNKIGGEVGRMVEIAFVVIAGAFGKVRGAFEERKHRILPSLTSFS
jgi:hypothetical protein